MAHRASPLALDSGYRRAPPLGAAPTDPMPRDLDRGVRLGRYDLLLKIGRGGMASVWVAHEHAQRPEDSRIVAIKAIHSNLAEEPEFVAMFLDEGRLVSRIRHPNVVDLYEVGRSTG